MSDVTEVITLIEQASKKEDQAAKLNLEAEALIEEAQGLCDHYNTRVETSYNSGSYLDKASTTKWTYCAICGKQLDTEVETHPWYG